MDEKQCICMNECEDKRLCNLRLLSESHHHHDEDVNEFRDVAGSGFPLILVHQPPVSAGLD